MPRTLIICESVHHGNTLKIAQILAKELRAEMRRPSEIKITELKKYDLIGFGSGIYDDMHHKSILKLVDAMPKNMHKKTFIFSTSGVPVAILGNKFLQHYKVKAHATLRQKLELKKYPVIGEFICPGFNTNVFLKYFGGINKHRPNEEDFEQARIFAKTVQCK